MSWPTTPRCLIHLIVTSLNVRVLLRVHMFSRFVVVICVYVTCTAVVVYLLWKEMIFGSERGLQCCLRGKLNMQDPNKSLRDPVYYRCNPIPHHRIGSKYRIYPTYDFACPFVDSIEGITHPLRSSEYHDRNAQYYRIQEDMGLRRVHIYEFSRLNMVYTLLSKRKLLWFVQNEKVDGWDDARFPTVQGIVRRGLQIEALIQFILEQVSFITSFI